MTKPLSEADWSDAPPEVQAAFYAQGGLLAAGGGATAMTFETSALASRLRN